MLLQAESFVCRRCSTDVVNPNASFDSPYHFHPENEIILIEQGRGTRHVADSIEPYGPGDLVMIGANVPHVYLRGPRPGGAGLPEASLVAQFLSHFLGAEFLAKPEMRGARDLIAAAAHGLHFDAATAASARPLLEQLVGLQGARRIGLLLQLLDLLAHAKGRPLARGALESGIPPKDRERLDRVLAYVARNYVRDLGLGDVARVAALQPTSFSRWFRHATGKPFVEYLTAIRLGHACRQLIESGRAVTEIAFDCGFRSLSHFAHRFHADRGMSPSEFRRRARSALGGG